MKRIKNILLVIMIGVLCFSCFESIKAFDLEPVTYHIKFYGTIYNRKGHIVDDNAMFEREYTFTKEKNTYVYGGTKDDPVRFDLKKNQTIILNYVEVNGRKTEVSAHPSNPLKANQIYDDLYFDYDASNPGAPENMFVIHLYRLTPIAVIVNDLTVTYDGHDKELSVEVINEENLKPGHSLVIENTSVTATNAGEYILNPGEVKVCTKTGNDVSYLYKLYTKTGTLTIEPISVILSVDNVEKTIGSEDPELTAKIEGLIEGETLDYKLVREAGEELGDYKITAEFTENPNYLVDVIEGKLSIVAPVIDEPEAEEPTPPEVDEPIITPDVQEPDITDNQQPIETPEIDANINPQPNENMPVVESPQINSNTGPTQTINTPTVNNTEQTEENIDDQEEIIEVNENKTPLAGIQRSWALVNLLATVITVILGIVMIIIKKNNDSCDEEKSVEKKRYTWMKLLGTAIAVISVIIFILTEDVTLPMVMLDKYTVVMIVIAMIQCVVLLTHTFIKKKESQEMKQV